MSLTITDATVRYPAAGARAGGEPTTAVDRVSLQVDTGRVVALLGPSGCGKSSLLRAVAGLEPLAGGTVSWDGTDLAGRPVHTRGFGLMFQDAQLFAHRDVAGNIGFGLQMAGMPRRERERRIADLLDLVGLPGFGDRAVASLSGGQAQRVALARSLAPRPRLLLLDEPLSALDRALRERLAADLHDILRRAGTTALYVTHDHDEAFTVADEIALMRRGRIVQTGTPQQLWSEPADAQAAEFLGYRVVRDGDGTELALSPQALQVQTGSGDTSTGRRGVAAALPQRVDAQVVSVGFSRGRTTAVVQIPHWGEHLAVAGGIVPLQAGDRVTVRLDPAGVIRF